LRRQVPFGYAPFRMRSTAAPTLRRRSASRRVQGGKLKRPFEPLAVRLTRIAPEDDSPLSAHERQEPPGRIDRRGLVILVATRTLRSLLGGG
jgi:hypothetical protein